MSRPPHAAGSTLVTLGLVLCLHLTMTAATSSVAAAQPTSPRATPITALSTSIASVRDTPAPAPVVTPAARRTALLTSVTALLEPALAPLRRRGSTLSKMLKVVNVVRAVPQKCGSTLMPAIGPLKRNKRLDTAATRYAKKMARNDWFAHDAPDGTDPGTRMKRAGYRWSRWGENIAAGYTGVAKVVAAWLASPSHCTTLMGDYVHVGFGHAYDASSTYGHYWVQDFASPR